MFLFLLYKSISSELLTPTGMTIEELERKIDEYVNPLITWYLPSVVIQISKDKKTVFQKSYGYADMEKKILTTNETLYHWGSISKIVVHTLMWKLYEEGKVDLNDDILKYLGKDFFSRRKYKDKITILNLMHHNAGWDDFMLSLFGKDYKTVSSLKKYLQSVEPRQFARPGEYIAYSNYGTAIEALIIENIVGKKYSEYAKEEVFMKLGMNHTSIDNSRADLDNFESFPHAISYLKFGERCKYQKSTVRVYPAGSVVSDIRDLTTFINDFIPCEGKESVLFKNKSSLEQFLSISYRPTENAKGIAHGLWEDFDENRTSYLEHGGNTEGMSSYAYFHPTNGWSICALTNLAHEKFILNKLPILMFGIYNKTYNSSNLEKYEGKYSSARDIHNGLFGLIKKLTIYLKPDELKVSNDIIKYSKGLNLIQIENNLFITNSIEDKNTTPSYQQYTFITKDNNIKSMYSSISEIAKLDMKDYVGTAIGALLYLIFLILDIIIILSLSISYVFIYRKKLQDDSYKGTNIFKYAIISFITSLLSVVSVIVLGFLYPLADGYTERETFVNVLGILIAINVLRWITVICGVALFIYDKMNENEEKNIEIEIGTDLIDNEVSKANTNKIEESCPYIKICIISSFVIAISMNIIGYSLEAYYV